LVIYTVRRGDSVYSIASKYGVSTQTVIDDNRIENPQQLVVGQALVIMTDSVSHTVAPGESLYTIAQSYQTTVQQLQAANPGITDPARILAGQTITIPVTTQKLGTIDVNGYALPGISSDILSETLPYLTYISIFSYQVKADGSMTPPDDSAILQASLGEHAAPMMVITNSVEGQGFNSDIAHAILTNTQASDTLLDNIVSVLQQNNYFGLNIDFEYIYPQDRENYNNFLRKVVGRLRPLGYIITTSLAPKTSAGQQGLLYEAHDYPVHGTLADHVILMTYEWGYTYGPARAVAPLNLVEQVIRYAVSVIPSEKILMGIPNYGYDWTLPFVQGSAARTLTNLGAVNLAASVGAQIQFDPVAQSPFFQYYDSNGRRHEVWFEDARSIEAKLRLVDRYQLGGVSYWTINSFFPQNWLVLESLFLIRKVR
jgi:spore germination protein